MNDKRSQPPVKPSKSRAADVDSDDSDRLERVYQELEPKLDLLPPEERELVAEMLEITLQHSGSIPLPSVAAGYERLMPGATDRLFRMAEAQVESIKSRIDADITAEQDERTKNQSYRSQGLWLGAAVSITLILSGAAVGIFGQAPVAGGFVSVFGVATGLAGMFVRGRPLRDDHTKPQSADEGQKHSPPAKGLKKQPTKKPPSRSGSSRR